jgi:hypothetical protein
MPDVPKHNWPPHDWPSLLEILRARPAMYMGARSVHLLDAFVGGFMVAEHAHELPEQKHFAGFSFEAFERWVAETIDERSWSSFRKAAERAGSADAGLDLWYQWYDEFRAITSTAQSHQST